MRKNEKKRNVRVLPVAAIQRCEAALKEAEDVMTREERLMYSVRMCVKESSLLARSEFPHNGM